MLTDLHTWGTGLDIPLTPVGPGEINLDIDFLNLMPETYNLGIWAASNGGEWHDVLDHVMTLEVEPSDYFGSGRGIESRFGLIFFPCRWRLSGRSADVSAVSDHTLRSGRVPESMAAPANGHSL